MRVLMLTDWPRLHGGAEAHLLALRQGLRRAGDEVRLLASDLSAEGRAAADYTAFGSERPAAQAFLQLSNPLAAAAVRRAVADFRPDVALVNMFALHLSPAAVRALRPVPYLALISDFKCICPLGHRLLPDGSACEADPGIACLRSGCLSGPHWLREQPRYARIRGVLERAGARVSISRRAQALLAERGIDTACLPLFSPPPGPDYRRAPADAATFLFLGRLDPEKGVDTLLRAFALTRKEAPFMRLRIVGRGALQPELEALAARLGIADVTTFVGWLEPPQVERQLATAWALVAPSRWPEPFGLVALEALQRGVPAIVTDHGGMAEQVEDGVTGLTFPAGDARALAAHLIDVATGRRFHPPTLSPERVRQIRERHSEERHVTRLRELLSTISRPSPGG